jgi:hypothetical protein
MPQPLPVRQHSSNDKAASPAKVLHTTAGNGKRGMQPAKYVSAVKPHAAAATATAPEAVLPAEVKFKQMPTAGAHSPSAPDARFKRDNSTADSRLKRENSNVDGQLKRENSNVDGKARLKRDNSAVGAGDSDAYKSGGSAGHFRVLPVADLHHDSSTTAPLSPRSSPASPRTPQFKRIASTAHDADDSAAATAPASPRGGAHRIGQREARVVPHGISRGPSMADSIGEAHSSIGGSVSSGAHAPAAAALAAAGAASAAASTASSAAAAAAAVPAAQRAGFGAQQRLLQRQRR